MTGAQRSTLANAGNRDGCSSQEPSPPEPSYLSLLLEYHDTPLAFESLSGKPEDHRNETLHPLARIPAFLSVTLLSANAPGGRIKDTDHHRKSLGDAEVPRLLPFLLGCESRQTLAG